MPGRECLMNKLNKNLRAIQSTLRQGPLWTELYTETCGRPITPQALSAGLPVSPGLPDDYNHSNN